MVFCKPYATRNTPPPPVELVTRGIETEEANKALVVVTLTGRVVMGYSGLARTRASDIFELVKHLLLEAGPPDYSWEKMVFRFAQALSDEFRKPDLRGLAPCNRRASFHFIGHVRTEPPTPTITYVSNWYDPANHFEADPPADEFRVSGGLFTHPSGDPRIVMPLGGIPASGVGRFDSTDGPHGGTTEAPTNCGQGHRPNA